MQFCNSKAGLTELLQDNLANPYKRRKRIKLDDSEQQSSTPSQDDDDMEIQNSDDESADRPVLFASNKPISSSSDLDESNSNILPEDASSESIQLSLLELKRKQEEILRALQDESSDSNSNSNPNSNPSPVNPDETPDNDEQSNATNDNNDATEKPPVETASNDATNANEPHQNDEAAVSALDTTCPDIEVTEANRSNQLESVQHTPSSSMAVGQSKLAVFGTPLIKQVSPFSKLPGGEKWSVGVTDVIDFENLPDATGTYKKMTGVLDKVRTYIKRINDDEHESS